MSEELKCPFHEKVVGILTPDGQALTNIYCNTPLGVSGDYCRFGVLRWDVDEAISDAKALADQIKSHTAAKVQAFADEILECGYKVQIEGLGFSKTNVVNEKRIKQIAAKHGAEVK